jgi:hypothetical protein
MCGCTGRVWSGLIRRRQGKPAGLESDGDDEAAPGGGACAEETEEGAVQDVLVEAARDEGDGPAGARTDR